MRKKDIFEGNKELQSSLFLAQSYQDAWADYSRSLKKERFARWDYVVLTASNEEQAEGFREQIQLRRVEGLLPIQTKVLILPDPEGKRVGRGVYSYISLGKTDDYTMLRGDSVVRNGMGFGHPNTFAGVVFSVFMIWCYFKIKKMKWYDFGIGILLIGLIDGLCNSRTSEMVMARNNILRGVEYEI